METTLALPENFKSLSAELNTAVLSVINNQTIAGFEKAYTVAVAIEKLDKALTPEYMKPIMALQGNRLGFKSDKVYDEKTVKSCLIEAVLMGLQPYGNEFNIIAGNTYATKEGLGAVLKKMNGLTYEIIPGLPRIDSAKGSGAVQMKIRWTINGSPTQERDIDFAIKVNNFMGADAVIGKATRKARKWLHDTLNGFEIPEGDVGDNDIPVKPTKQIISHADLKELCESKWDLLTSEEQVLAQRILKDKEEPNYAKLQSLLNSK
jgi:hypothetical protein